MESEEVSPGVVIDFNKNDEAVVIEILNTSERTSVPNIKELHFKLRLEYNAILYDSLTTSTVSAFVTTRNSLFNYRLGLLT